VNRKIVIHGRDSLFAKSITPKIAQKDAQDFSQLVERLRKKNSADSAIENSVGPFQI
jgi:hypothetical protein